MYFRLPTLALIWAAATPNAYSQGSMPAASLDAITVTATPLRTGLDSMAVPVDVLDGSALMLQREATLGATLSGLPGVHADTFGGGVSRPVIRGQSAPRVAVVSDGSAVMDASAISPDHAISVEPMLAQRIEVLRGPSALLYGGGAFGGVVNVIDDRVPLHVPESGVEGFAELNAATGARTRAGAFGVTAGRNNFAVHVEAMKRRADDYRVPDWTDSTVPGSWEDSATGSVGMSWIGDRGFMGLAYSRTESNYGLPGHSHDHIHCHPHGDHLHCGGNHAGHPEHGDEHEHGEDEHAEHGHDLPLVRLKTDRVDWRAEFDDPMAGIRHVKLRGGFTDYTHREIEDGRTLTSFTNRGYDLRIEAEHAPLGGWRGVFGVQASRSDFAAQGEESFLPESRSDNLALFLFEEYLLGDWRFELGARHDWQSVKPQGDNPEARFRGASVSSAAVWEVMPGYKAALSLSRSQRMPSAQELYADGVHLATNTYEVGNPQLKKETSNNIDLSLGKHEGDLRWGVSVFHNRIQNYIHAATLDRHDEFQLVEYRQADAEFTGFEAHVDYRFNRYVTGGVFGDLVRARFTDGSDLPRIPAARAGLRLTAKWDDWSGNLEWYRVLKQTRTAMFEDETPGYNMVNASLSYQADVGDSTVTTYLRVSNLFNQLAYNHTSFIKSAAPLAGRQFMLGVRIEH